MAEGDNEQDTGFTYVNRLPLNPVTIYRYLKHEEIAARARECYRNYILLSTTRSLECDGFDYDW